MTAAGFLLAASCVAAIVALGLAFGRRAGLARRTAQLSLWLALSAPLLSLAADGFDGGSDAGNSGSKATRLGRAISHAMNYGTAALPLAGLAAIALRRAKVVVDRSRAPR